VVRDADLEAADKKSERTERADTNHLSAAVEDWNKTTDSQHTKRDWEQNSKALTQEKVIPDLKLSDRVAGPLDGARDLPKGHEPHSLDPVSQKRWDDLRPSLPPDVQKAIDDYLKSLPKEDPGFNPREPLGPGSFKPTDPGFNPREPLEPGSFKPTDPGFNPREPLEPVDPKQWDDLAKGLPPDFLKALDDYLKNPPADLPKELPRDAGFVQYDYAGGPGQNAAKDGGGDKLDTPENRQKFLDKHGPSQAEREEYEKLKSTFKSAEEKRRFLELEPKVQLGDSLKKIDENPQLSDDQKKKIRDSVEKILDDKSQKMGWTDSERQQVARELVHQIAHPESISQGGKNTCPPAVDASVLIRDHPEKYAQHVASLVTEGKLLGKDVLTPNAVRTDDGAPDRSLTSRIFQTGYNTLALGDRTPPEVYANLKPGEVPPGEVIRGKDLKPPADETGEWVWKPVKNPQTGEVVTNPETGKPVLKWQPFEGIPTNNADDLMKLRNDLVRDPAPDYNQPSEKRKTNPQSDTYQKAEIDRSEGPIKVAEQLHKLAEQHGYPIQVTIKGEHTILITNVDPKTGKIEIQDTNAPHRRTWKIGDGNSDLKLAEGQGLDPEIIVRKRSPKKNG